MTEPDKVGGSSNSPGSMLFIVPSNGEKVDSAIRKLIRSHARRGKTKQRSHPDEDTRAASRGTIIGDVQTASIKLKLEEVIETYTPLVPGRFGLDPSFAKFTDEVELPIVLKMATAAIGFQGDNRGWISPFGLDRAVLHIMAFAVQGFIDRVLHRHETSTNPAAMLHFQRGLRLLRDRLLGDDDEIKVSDSTMSIVLKLASTAHFNGNYNASKQHMEGLRKMVDLRGGLDVFKDTTLLVEMLRCDLSIAVLNGSTPVFFAQCSEPVTEYPEKLMPAPDDKTCFEDNTELVQILNNELATAWRAMMRFCLLVNLGTQTQRLIRPEIIHETMTAVMYRLLRIGVAPGSIDESVRLGLLAFSYHVFLQWQDIKLRYDHFPAIYKECILRPKPADDIPPQLILWLLMTGAISVFDISDEVWLGEHMQEYAIRCQVKTWKEMQGMLKSFMWVVTLDEQQGKHIYTSLQRNKEK